MAERGIEESFWPTVHQYRYEARFLRALAYVYLMDMYGNPPFITESNYSSEPSQIGRAELFNWIEKELTDIKDELVEAKTAGFYGRADQGVVNALLSRMYLNAEVYTGKPMYDKCVAISKEIIDMPVYGLADTYADLFKADNDRSDVAKEFIFPIVYEGTKTQTFGGIRFLIAAYHSCNHLRILLQEISERSKRKKEKVCPCRLGVDDFGGIHIVFRRALHRYLRRQVRDILHQFHRSAVQYRYDNLLLASHRCHSLRIVLHEEEKQTRMECVHSVIAFHIGGIHHILCLGHKSQCQYADKRKRSQGCNFPVDLSEQGTIWRHTAFPRTVLHCYSDRTKRRYTEVHQG